MDDTLTFLGTNRTRGPGKMELRVFYFNKARIKLQDGDLSEGQFSLISWLFRERRKSNDLAAAPKRNLRAPQNCLQITGIPFILGARWRDAGRDGLGLLG